MLEIAYDKPASPRMLGRAYHVSKYTVVRAHAISALAYLSCQGILLAKCAEYAKACPPTYAVCALGWDETGEKLALSILPGCQQQQKTPTW